MNSACQQFRTELPEGADGRLDATAFAGGHAAQCAECAAWAERVVRVDGALRSLERKPVPAELAGLVVATLQAGAREDRAVRAVENLSRPTSPSRLTDSLSDRFADTVADEDEGELERALAASPLAHAETRRAGAPSVLERLVREELAAPEQFVVRRFVGGLARLDAPAALDARVAEALARELRGPRPVGTAPRRLLGPSVRGLIWGGLAAAALVAIGLNALLGVSRSVPDPAQVAEVDAPRVRPFEVVYADSTAGLDPLARSLVDGVSGGMLTAKGL